MNYLTSLPPRKATYVIFDAKSRVVGLKVQAVY